jgi:hypothetical protein
MASWRPDRSVVLPDTESASSTQRSMVAPVRSAHAVMVSRCSPGDMNPSPLRPLTRLTRITASRVRALAVMVVVLSVMTQTLAPIGASGLAPNGY